MSTANHLRNHDPTVEVLCRPNFLLLDRGLRGAILLLMSGPSSLEVRIAALEVVFGLLRHLQALLRVKSLSIMGH